MGAREGMRRMARDGAIMMEWLNDRRGIRDGDEVMDR